MMNIFRLAGDMSHLASVFILLFRIHTTKSSAGISLKTHELYALVFVTRYLDLLTSFVSLYNTCMKMIFLVTSFAMIWYMRGHEIVRKSYDKDFDTFRHYALILGCLVLALPSSEEFYFMEVIWTFSQYLEAVAILPQLVLLHRMNNIHNLPWQYVFLLGIYRPLYILNWIYRYYTLPYSYWRHIVRNSYIAGFVQTLIYGIFCYYYVNSWRNSHNVEIQEASQCYKALTSAASGVGQDLVSLDPANSENVYEAPANVAPGEGQDVSENEKINLVV